MSLVVPATACLLILGSLGAIIMAPKEPKIIVKYKIALPVCITEGTDSRSIRLSVVSAAY
jgi:hypothetical protein